MTTFDLINEATEIRDKLLENENLVGIINTLKISIIYKHVLF
jgi:hypothetical protein